MLAHLKRMRYMKKVQTDHIYAICDSEYHKCAFQQESEEGPLLLQINLEETERKVAPLSTNRPLLSTITFSKLNHLTTPNSKFVVKYQIFPNVTAKKSNLVFIVPFPGPVASTDARSFFLHHYHHSQQTWNLSKNLHRRIFSLKILHRQFHLISTVLVGKKHKKMGENGEIYTACKYFTLPPAVTAWTNSTSEGILIKRM